MPTADQITDTIHAIRTIPHTIQGWYLRICPCGYESAPFVGRREDRDNRPCPNDDTITALVTLQFAAGGLFDARPVDGYAIHLVRSKAGGGTPGPTLCGIDRFAKDSPGWSVGGGVSGPSLVLKPCPGCAETARSEFAGLPVCGSVGGREMAAELGTEYRNR